MPATAQPLVLDHAVIGVLDKLDSAAAIYRKLGFALTPRGYHTLGSINHLAVFDGNYLELLGFPSESEKTRTDLWSYPSGLNGLAFRTSDAAALQGELVKAGKPVTDWRDFSRPVDVDGVPKPASFRTFQIGGEVISNGRFFFCQHNTPELVWRPIDQNHPNGVLNISDVFIVSRASQVITGLLDGFPAAAPEANKDSISIRAGTATIHILSEDGASARFGSAIPQGFEGNERKVALGLKVRSLNAAADALVLGGFSPKPFEGGLLVEAEAANGVALWFRE
ncbi:MULTISPECIES: VOC family protein [Rhizobium]|uniref:Glyoxalase-like domain-containing protein n=1 Tax=Rhizobium miluonense TaxID=411945 RepID=A0A1C3UYS3_9HYPH|nr:VOC family protein [Rhizobium miluonense]SCB20568.1 Glyoxalase-like domain-containing protein [Rhizobium miluonense]